LNRVEFVGELRDGSDFGLDGFGGFRDLTIERCDVSAGGFFFFLQRNSQKAAATAADNERLAASAEWVEQKRKRLASLSWFMKCLKEPLARLANREEHRHGTFFEGRFQSIAILDEESILTVAAYIDLKPVAAGLCSLPDRLLTRRSTIVSNMCWPQGDWRTCSRFAAAVCRHNKSTRVSKTTHD
jgi:hypothetical protein